MATIGDALAFYYRGSFLLVPFAVSEDVDGTRDMIATIEGWHRGAPPSLR